MSGNIGNPKLRGAPFSLVINGQEYLQERLGKVQVAESLLEPFQIHITLVPSEGTALQSPFLNTPAVLKLDAHSVPEEHFSLAANQEAQYCGYVASEKRLYGAGNKLLGVMLEIWHPLHLLQKGSHARIFSINTETKPEGENKLEDIIEAVLMPYKGMFESFGLQGIQYDSLPPTSLPYITQFAENDFHFLLRLCETYGICFVQNGNSLIFKSSKAARSSSYEIDAASEFLWEYYATDASRTLESRDSDYSFPYSNLPAAVPTASNTVGDGAIPHYVQKHHLTGEEGNQLLTVIGDSLTYAEKELHVWSQMKPLPDNRPLVGIRAGDCMSLPGAQGEYLIHRVSWYYQGTESAGGEGIEQHAVEGYRIDVYGRESQVTYAPPLRHPKYRSAGWQKAIVIAPAIPDKSDKDQQLGRIKVRFLWDKHQEQRLVDRPEHTAWVRLVMPYAGKNHGFYVMPEVGDEVIVSFEEGDMDRPLCLGSVYNVESAFLAHNLSPMQPVDYTAQMETAKLKTPKNLVLEFWEAEQDSNRQRIELSANKKITLTMNIEGSKIAYELDSLGTISVHAVGKITEDSDTEVLIKRGSAASIKMDKDGNIEIKGKTLNIQTTGNTEVKAALIKLNC